MDNSLMDMYKPQTMQFADGRTYNVQYEELTVIPPTTDDDGTGGVAFTLTGKLVPVQPNPQEESVTRPYMRNYMMRSALVRFLHDGRLQTAAITHCTDKAWRIINLALGVAWIPKNIIRWSDVAGQFCIVDSTYMLNFTQDVGRNQGEYPLAFDPDEVIYYEYD